MAAGMTVCRTAVLCSFLALALLAVATQAAKKDGAGGALNEKVRRAGAGGGGLKVHHVVPGGRADGAIGQAARHQTKRQQVP